MRIKGLSVALLTLGLVLLASSPVFAASAREGMQTSRPLESTGMFTDRDGNTMNYEIWIHGISIYADAASSYMGVYDAATKNAFTNTTAYAKDEIGEATQYDTQYKWYSPPELYENGVGAIINTGVGFVHYGPRKFPD